MEAFDRSSEINDGLTEFLGWWAASNLNEIGVAPCLFSYFPCACGIRQHSLDTDPVFLTIEAASLGPSVQPARPAAPKRPLTAHPDSAHIPLTSSHTPSNQPPAPPCFSRVARTVQQPLSAQAHARAARGRHTGQPNPPKRQH